MTAETPSTPAPANRAKALLRLLSQPPHLRAGITFFVTLAMARHLGASEFGLLSSATGMVSLLLVWSRLGLDTAVRGDFARKPEETALGLGTCMALRVGAAAVGYVALLWCVGEAAPSGLRTVWLVAGMALFLQSPLSVDLWLEAKGASRFILISQYTGFAISTVARLWLISGNVPVLWFAAVLALESTVGALVLFYAHGKLAPADDAFGWDAARARAWLRQSAAPLVRALLAMAPFPLVAAIMPFVTSSAEAGQLASAQVFFEFGLYIFSAVLASRLARRSPAPARPDRLADAATLMMKVGWISALGIAGGAPWIARWILGPDFEGAVMPLRILAVALIPASLGAVRAVLWQAAPAPRKTVLADVAGLVLAAAGLWLLAPRFGATGGALACLGSLAVSQFAIAAVWRDSRELFKMQLDALLLKALWRSMKTSAAPAVKPNAPAAILPPGAEAPGPAPEGASAAPPAAAVPVTQVAPAAPQAQGAS